MKKKLVLISVGDNHGGLGDLLYSFKLARQLEDCSKQVEVIIVTGKKLVASAGQIDGVNNFGIKVILLNDLPSVLSGNVQVEAVIEAPVRSFSLLYGIECALQEGGRSGTRIPLYTVLEYGYYNYTKQVHDKMLSSNNLYASTFSNLKFERILYSGLGSKELGVFLMDAHHGMSKYEMIDSLDEKIKTVLYPSFNSEAAGTRSISVASIPKGAEEKVTVPGGGGQLNSIKTHGNDSHNNDSFYFQYSHDTVYDTLHKVSASTRFLHAHLAWTCGTDNDQTVLMLGKNFQSKKQAMSKLLPHLARDGYTNFEMVNLEDDTIYNLKLNESAEGRSKKYRVIYARTMTHRSMNAVMKLSEKLIGVTGDQSLIEAVSMNKVVIYEGIKHKKDLINSYYNLLISSAGVFPSQKKKKVISVLRMLKEAKFHKDFSKLRKLIRQHPDLKHNVEVLDCASQVKSRPGEAIHNIVLGFNYNIEAQSQSFNPLSELTYWIRTDKGGDAPITTTAFESWLVNNDTYALNSCLDHRYLRSMNQFHSYSDIVCRVRSDGVSHLKWFLKNCPNEEVTNRLLFVVVRSSLQKYFNKKKGKPRRVQYSGLIDFLSSFSFSRPTQLHKALLGLIILCTRDIAGNFKVFTPQKGVFIGSSLYTLLTNFMRNVGSDLRTLSSPLQHEFLSEFSRYIDRHPDLKKNKCLNKHYRYCQAMRTLSPRYTYRSQSRAALSSAKDLRPLSTQESVTRNRAALFKSSQSMSSDAEFLTLLGDALRDDHILDTEFTIFNALNYVSHLCVNTILRSSRSNDILRTIKGMVNVSSGRDIAMQREFTQAFSSLIELTDCALLLLVNNDVDLQDKKRITSLVTEFLIELQGVKSYGQVNLNELLMPLQLQYSNDDVVLPLLQSIGGCIQIVLNHYDAIHDAFQDGPSP